MIAIDTNILVYAHRADLAFSRAARSAIEGLCGEPGDWAIAWPSVHEFFATVTHRGKFQHPSSTAQALRQIDLWLGVPNLQLLGETAAHWGALSTLLRTGQIHGGAVHDARIAAICLQHGVREFWTADRDFSRFPQLKCRNPLILSP